MAHSSELTDPVRVAGEEEGGQVRGVLDHIRVEPEDVIILEREWERVGERERDGGTEGRRGVDREEGASERGGRGELKDRRTKGECVRAVKRDFSREHPRGVGRLAAGARTSSSGMASSMRLRSRAALDSGRSSSAAPPWISAAPRAAVWRAGCPARRRPSWGYLREISPPRDSASLDGSNSSDTNG